MSVFNCEHTCKPGDMATDTVKVDVAGVLAAEQLIAEKRTRLEEAARKRAEEDAARQRAQEEETAQMRRRAEAQRRAMEAWQVEEARRAAQARDAEMAFVKSLSAEDEAAKAARAARQAVEADAAARAAEAAWQQEEERLRRATVAAFLKEHGFSGACAPRRKLLKTTYPLHKAAKLADVQLVKMLLQEGASLKQTDSRGKTASQVAHSYDNKGSHAAVLALLGSDGHAHALMRGGA